MPGARPQPHALSRGESTERSIKGTDPDARTSRRHAASSRATTPKPSSHPGKIIIAAEISTERVGPSGSHLRATRPTTAGPRPKRRPRGGQRRPRDVRCPPMTARKPREASWRKLPPAEKAAHLLAKETIADRFWTSEPLGVSGSARAFVAPRPAAWREIRALLARQTHGVARRSEAPRRSVQELSRQLGASGAERRGRQARERRPERAGIATAPNSLLGLTSASPGSPASRRGRQTATRAHAQSRAPLGAPSRRSSPPPRPRAAAPTPARPGAAPYGLDGRSPPSERVIAVSSIMRAG